LIVNYDLEAIVIFTLEFIWALSKFVLRKDHDPQSDERSLDLHANLNCAVAIKEIGSHDCQVQ